MLTFLAFFGMLLVTFGGVAFVMRSSPDEKAVNQRIVSIKSTGVNEHLAGSALSQLLKTTQKGNFRWLERMLRSHDLAQSTQLLIVQANSKTTIGSLAVSSIGTAAAGFVACYVFIPAPWIALGAGVLFGYAPMGLLLARRKRRIASFNAALPDSIDMMARALRAGHSLVASLNIIAEQAVEPARSEFGEVFKKQNYGLPLRDALMQLMDRVPSQDLRVLVTAMLVQKDTGGNLAEILDRTVYVIRQRLRIQGEIRIHTAQGRMTGWILCSLPVAMMLLLNILNPGYSKVLLDDPFGRELLYAGAALLAVGGFLIRKIVNGIEV